MNSIVLIQKKHSPKLCANYIFDKIVLSGSHNLLFCECFADFFDFSIDIQIEA